MLMVARYVVMEVHRQVLKLEEDWDDAERGIEKRLEKWRDYPLSFQCITKMSTLRNMKFACTD